MIIWLLSELPLQQWVLFGPDWKDSWAFGVKWALKMFEIKGININVHLLFIDGRMINI